MPETERVDDILQGRCEKVELEHLAVEESVLSRMVWPEESMTELDKKGAVDRGEQMEEEVVPSRRGWQEVVVGEQ
jgi:hypothetical protein